MKNKKFIFICGMCATEGKYLPIAVATYLKNLTSKYNVDFIFKISYDKANRTSINSYRGLGVKEGLQVIKEIKEKVKCKILTDVHCEHQVLMADVYSNSSIDIYQIPAFLCRQTDLITRLAKTGKTINIKKGQFLAPGDVRYIIEKVKSEGNNDIMITERGTCFGYNELVVDFRSFSVLKNLGYPVIFDASHSVKNSKFTIPFVRAAVAYGVDGIYLEVHPNPKEAKSDSESSLYMYDVEKVLKEIERLRK